MDRLISADALIEQEKFYAEKYKGDFGEQVATHVIEVINQAPTVDPVRHGKWKRTPSNWGALFECSECGETATETVMGYPRYIYCPMFGAKMDAERREE